MDEKQRQRRSKWHRQKIETDPLYAEQMRERARNWYYEHTEIAKQNQMAWREVNIEAYREYQREYQRKWREANKQRWLEICRASYHRNKNKEGTSE